LSSIIKYLPAFYLLFTACQRNESGSAKPIVTQKQIKSCTESTHDPDDTDGVLSHRPEISPQSFIVKSVFNQKGDLLMKYKYNDHGNLEWREMYTYDKDGRLLEIVSHHFKQVSSWITNKYNEENQLVERNDFAGDGKNIARQIIRKGSNSHTMTVDYMLIRGALQKTSERLFDEKENNVKNSYFVDGRLTEQEENRYDSLGNRVESIRSGPPGSPKRITLNKYDNRNNAVETLVLDGNSMIESKIINRYNDQHHVVESLTYGIRGNLKERVQHLYEYDEFKHWTKDVAVINRKPVSVRIRKLEYF
jgi:hypothetical protein